MAKWVITPVQILIFFVVLFITAMPFVRSISFGLGFLVGLMLMMSFVVGAFITQVLMAVSPTLILADGTRKSRSSTDSFIELGDSEHLPAMKGISYGGIRSLGISQADNSILVCPAETVEPLSNDGTLIRIYTFGVPLRKKFSLSGLFPSLADLLAHSQDTAFRLEGHKGEARVGFHNTLLQRPSTEDLHEMQVVFDQSGMELAQMRDVLTLGEEAGIRELRKLASTVRKAPLTAAIKQWFSGQDSDRPGELNTYEEEKR